MFARFDGHLARRGYIARGGQILDASIVPVRCPHNKREENTAIKAGETPEGRAYKPAKQSQKDVDARWTKKHGKSHYGYKNHVNVDRMHKLVRRYHVSDAAVHGSQAVDELLMRGNTGSGVWENSAYRSEEMEASCAPGSSKATSPTRAIAPLGHFANALPVGGQAGERAGPEKQPDQIRKPGSWAGPGRAYLWRAGQ